MELHEIIVSKNFRRGIEIAVAVLVLLVVFGTGVFVGLEKARFSYRWGENYFRNFAGPRPMSLDRGYLNAHGIAGAILKIGEDGLVIQDKDGDERNILITEQTMIKRGPTSANITQLKTGEYIVSIGSPNNEGEINAKFIRIMPGPPLSY